MDFQVHLLGTGASAPTLVRSTPSTVIAYGPERVLVDAGEGTQLQLLASVIGMGSIPTLLLTHGHSDHYLGIPGLMKTWSGRGRTEPLSIIGPPGTWQLIRGMGGIIGHTTYPVRITEPEPGEPIRLQGLTVTPVRTRHRIISYGWLVAEDDRPGAFDGARAKAAGVPDGPELGRLARGGSFRLPDGALINGADLIGEPRPGRRVLLTGDTEPCEAVAEAAAGVDLLVHEATFLEADRALARSAGHSTASEAAHLAAQAGARALCLTHLSSRYETDEVRREATEAFPGAIVPSDLDMVDVPMPERAPATLVGGGSRGPGA